MDKNLIRGIAIFAVVLLAYHLIVFLVPFSDGAIFWISYLFTLLGLDLSAITCFVAFKRGSSAKSRFYGFPIIRLGVLYGIFQLIAGLVGMALGAILPLWIPIVVYVIGFAAAVIGLIATDTVRDSIEDQDVQHKKAISVIRSLQSKVNQLPMMCENENAMKAVQDLAEELRYSDPVSSPAIAQAETQLVLTVEELQKAVDGGDAVMIVAACKKTSRVLAERNRLCKLNK